LTESFVNVLKEFCENDNTDASNNKTKCHLSLVPSNEYSKNNNENNSSGFKIPCCCFLGHETIKSRILALRLPCEPEGSLKDDESHMNYIHSLIDLNNDCSVYALGALFKFLDKNWGSLNLEVREQTAPIVALKRISL